MPKKAPEEPEISMETVHGRTLRVARWRLDRPSDHPPLLFFNGIGANIEAAMPLAEALPDRGMIMFDMPGVGGSPDPVLPYNAITMALLTNQLLRDYAIEQVDVMGVSWGGAMAQHFAFQHGGSVRKLILAATTPGMLMVPGKLSALSKMADPRRYIDRDYMATHFETLYGGSTSGSDSHMSRLSPPSRKGYLFQLIAMLGWTSAPFLPFMGKETLILTGSDDNIVLPVNGHLLNRLIPNSQLKIIEGGGHLFMLSHVDETMGHIRAFLDA